MNLKLALAAEKKFIVFVLFTSAGKMIYVYEMRKAKTFVRKKIIQKTFTLEEQNLLVYQCE